MNLGAVSTVHYAEAQIRDCVTDLVKAIPSTRTPAEATEIAEAAGALGMALLRIEDLALTRAKHLGAKDGR